MWDASLLETRSFRDVRSPAIGRRMTWRWWPCRAQSSREQGGGSRVGRTLDAGDQGSHTLVLTHHRREDLHSKEFFEQLKPRRWKANVAELYRTKRWDAPNHLEHDTVTTDTAIRREFRRYYVWLYSPKSAQRIPQLESTLADRPLNDLDRRRLEGST